MRQTAKGIARGQGERRRTGAAGREHACVFVDDTGFGQRVGVRPSVRTCEPDRVADAGMLQKGEMAVAVARKQRQAGLARRSGAVHKAGAEGEGLAARTRKDHGRSVEAREFQFRGGRDVSPGPRAGL
tara:strand:+ start:965 stop:1348 length:384 start_codon:yes stop_codon:yes gene_type:complete